MTSFIEIGSLYLARITPLFLMPNLLPIAKLPSSVKIILSLSIALILAVAIEPSYTYQPLKWEQFLIAIIQELVIGMGLVFGIQVTLSSILFAGKIIDLQLGFGVASVLDPMTQTQEALIGTLLNSLFTVSFFILDIHHLLIKGIATTFEHFPVGSGMIVASSSHLVSFFSSQFILGILIVMPVILGLFLLDTVIAFTSKTMPQVNVYFVSLPLKIFVGLFILSVSLKYMAGYIGNTLSQSIQNWFTGFEVF